MQVSCCYLDPVSMNKTLSKAYYITLSLTLNNLSMKITLNANISSYNRI